MSLMAFNAFGAVGDLSSSVGLESTLVLPVDKNGIPLQENSLGLPTFSEAVTLTTSSYVSLLTVPATGHNATRVYRHMIVKNPSSTRTLYICFGDSSSCATNMLKIPASTTIAYDGLYFGAPTSVVKIYGKLDDTGSVVPELTIW
jgi:hypothetical protein